MRGFAAVLPGTSSNIFSERRLRFRRASVFWRFKHSFFCGFETMRAKKLHGWFAAASGEWPALSRPLRPSRIGCRRMSAKRSLLGSRRGDLPESTLCRAARSRQFPRASGLKKCSLRSGLAALPKSQKDRVPQVRAAVALHGMASLLSFRRQGLL